MSDDPAHRRMKRGISGDEGGSDHEERGCLMNARKPRKRHAALITVLVVLWILFVLFPFLGSRLWGISIQQDVRYVGYTEEQLREQWGHPRESYSLIKIYERDGSVLAACFSPYPNMAVKDYLLWDAAEGTLSGTIQGSQTSWAAFQAISRGETLPYDTGSGYSIPGMITSDGCLVMDAGFVECIDWFSYTDPPPVRQFFRSFYQVGVFGGRFILDFVRGKLAGY